jgi:hypothetical protein
MLGVLSTLPEALATVWDYIVGAYLLVADWTAGGSPILLGAELIAVGGIAAAIVILAARRADRVTRSTNK